jgi:hypothetical protein
VSITFLPAVIGAYDALLAVAARAKKVLGNNWHNARRLPACHLDYFNRSNTIANTTCQRELISKSWVQYLVFVACFSRLGLSAMFYLPWTISAATM